MGELRFIKPGEGYEKEWADTVREFTDRGERLIPQSLTYGQPTLAEVLAVEHNMQNGLNLPENFVPSTTYWLVDEHNRLLGAANIRHFLNDRLLTVGGHIGYGVRPSERRKGYATLILAKALQICAEMGIAKALVTCDVDNTGSERTIRKNGGVLEDIRSLPDFDNASAKKRFWIDTAAPDQV